LKHTDLHLTSHVDKATASRDSSPTYKNAVVVQPDVAWYFLQTEFKVIIHW